MGETATVDSSSNERESVHKTITAVATSAAGCALAAFVFGAYLDAAWPGAVAACGIALMAVGVTWVVGRRS